MLNSLKWNELCGVNALNNEVIEMKVMQIMGRTRLKRYLLQCVMEWK